MSKSSSFLCIGGIGYFSANGDFDTCIALRTAVSTNKKFGENTNHLASRIIISTKNSKENYKAFIFPFLDYLI